jgi:hypothetical protein
MFSVGCLRILKACYKFKDNFEKKFKSSISCPNQGLVELSTTEQI